MAAGDYAFGSANLHDRVSYFVTRARPPVVPTELLRMPLARFEGSAITQTRYGENTATIEGRVKGTSLANLEANLDALLLNLTNGQQNLKLGRQDERYWQARLQGSPSFERRSPDSFAYSAEFLVANPFGNAAALTTPANDTSAMSSLGGGLYRKTVVETAGGNIYARPRWTLTITTLGGTTQVTVRNTTTGEALIVARAFALNDILVVDSETQVVTVNGTAADYSGTFPLLDPRLGANSIQLDALAASLPAITYARQWRSRFAG